MSLSSDSLFTRASAPGRLPPPDAFRTAFNLLAIGLKGVDVKCGPCTTGAVGRHLFRTNDEHYAMVMYVSDVEVIRPQKF